MRTLRTGADTPGIDDFCTLIVALAKSSTNRSGFCMRAACTSNFPAPSTRIAARCGACVIATLEITAAFVLAPAGA
jgi:hypothetical protein